MIFKRKGLAYCLESIGKWIASILFFLRLFIKENFKDYIRKNKPKKLSRDMIILANGPSLKDSLKDIVSDISLYVKTDFFVINDFSASDEYDKIHPVFYALSDSKYFVDTIYKEQSERTLRLIDEKTTWSMYLYIPFKYYKSFLRKKVINNPLIKVVPFHSLRFWGLDSMRMYVYKKGLGNGKFGTVVINAIYVSIVLGFKNIFLYGIDHNFFDGLFVTKDNVLCYKYAHFYDDKEPEIKPMISHHDGITQPFTMQDFLVEKLDVFTGHVVMKRFSEYMGCNIWNATNNSLVDTYQRMNYIDYIKKHDS